MTYLQKAQMESMKKSGEKEELCKWRNLTIPRHAGDKGQNQ